jgi:hypothetical protein
MLFNLTTAPFVALGPHEWTAICPSVDRKHNVGKYAFVNAVIYYVLLKFYSLLT